MKQEQYLSINLVTTGITEMKIDQVSLTVAGLMENVPVGAFYECRFYYTKFFNESDVIV